MQPRYLFDGSVHEVTPLCLGEQLKLIIDGHLLDVSVHWHDHHQGELIVNGSANSFYAAQDGNTLHIHFAGKVWVIEAQDEFSATSGESASAGQIHAPMPGVVVEVSVSPGDQVEAGQSLLLIESMKLQTEIKASVTGRVKNIGAAVGESFDRGSVLIDIQVESQADKHSE